MNGPDHYREAELLLRPRTKFYNGGQTEAEIMPSAQEVAVAQAHATLALAAATVDAGMRYDGSIRHEDQWREVVK